MSGAQHWARVGLVAIAAVAAVEWGASAFVYRSRVTNQDLDAARQALDASVPVWLATDWLGPRARMTIPALADLSSVARPDLRGASRFSVLGVGDTWSDTLRADNEDMPPPRLVGTEQIGDLTLSTYEQDAAGTITWDLLSDPRGIKVEIGGDRCKGQSRRWRCNLGDVQLRTAEIDFRPRRCLTANGDDGVPVRIVAAGVQTGNVLRGHVGFEGFNARLRSDAAAEVTVTIAGRASSRFLFTDDQGWAPFAVAVTPGLHDIAVQVVTSARGTWGNDGYDPGRAHEPCVELRSLQEDGR